jgi:hypothetical protein
MDRNTRPLPTNVREDLRLYHGGRTRPTKMWRAQRQAEAEDLAAGRIDPAEVVCERLFPDTFLDAVDELLNAYDSCIVALGTGPNDYPRIMACMERAVVGLRDLEKRLGKSYVDTDERELLCAYLDNVIIQHGIDIRALAEWQGCGEYELADVCGGI